MTGTDKAREIFKSFGFDDFTIGQMLARFEKNGLTVQDLTKATLVPVEVFNDDGNWGLMDAVPAYSDCNRAIGHIYRLDDEDTVKYRDPKDVITIYVSSEELAKFSVKYGEG